MEHPRELVPVAIYVHFPFCLRKCPYCDFVSYDDSDIDHGDYIESILGELAIVDFWGGGREAVSIYIGGGTPSLMTPKLVDTLIEGIHRRLPMSSDAEVTIEVNPATADAADMSAWRAGGVNRISLGVQSTDPATLETLGRLHTAEEGLAAYELARRAGFDVVSVDMIFGTPGQRREIWMADLGRVIDREPDHLSAYMLKAPSGWETPPDEEVADMYLSTVESLDAAGLMQYEVSNFARAGKECRHNIVYWKKGDYIGLGVAAHSHLKAANFINAGTETTHPAGKMRKKDTASLRWWNVTDPEEYMDHIDNEGNAVEGAESIDVERDINESLLLGLRLREGIDAGVLDTPHRRAVEIVGAQLAEVGLVSFDGTRVYLTPRGMLLADEIAAKIASAVSDTPAS